MLRNTTNHMRTERSANSPHQRKSAPMLRWLMVLRSERQEGRWEIGVTAHCPLSPLHPHSPSTSRFSIVIPSDSAPPGQEPRTPQGSRPKTSQGHTQGRTLQVHPGVQQSLTQTPLPFCKVLAFTHLLLFFSFMTIKWKNKCGENKAS